ncbi:MAG: LysE family transporter [Rhizobacter sp.]|nr:LysE family transporter [Burkholderiales bacterium]
MLTSLASLALLYLAALIIPGPNLLLLTHTAASASRRAALGVAFGIATGTLLWVGIAVFGVQKIFNAAPMLQTSLRVAGGVYLLYLAYGLLRSLWGDRSGASNAVTSVAGAEVAREAGSGQSSYFRRGLLTNLTNPKSFAFWTSVAVVSLDPNALLATRLLAVFMVAMMAVVWHIVLAFVFSTPPAQRAYLRAKPMLSLVTGVVMGAFGTRLLWGLRG